MKTKLDNATFFLSKKVGRALTDYKMMEDGDKILVAVSGGKDSLSLLRILKYRQSFVPIKYEIMAVHIDMGYDRKHSVVLRKYFKKNGYKYHIGKERLQKKGQRPEAINCFWCSWNRRKALFKFAERSGYKKIALGHHKDDIIETMLMNLFFNGEISAMSPKQELFGGKITILRPLAYVEEKELARFSRLNRFPAVKCGCPNAGKTQREKMGRLIKEVERTCPAVKSNMFNSMKKIKKEYMA
ncbi:MAG: tRNA 2-thiocytidine(32) synthetase TtcA [Candidatus Omnitrophica bacterium]|nr:tRNA 2-thiocytidine(32) synthetase TtcA [Candidatus Omnitrophota bacterium]